MEICKENLCTGCSACMNICPVNCITMKEDKYGVLHPETDENKCIGCKKCSRICPANNELPLHKPLSCYAAWRNDQEKRLNSSSGGIGAVIAERAAASGTVIFGTCFADDFRPVFSEAADPEETDKFKGSKYVQSYVGFAYQRAGKLLEENRKVIFVGSPCQISGLYAFLAKDYENLTTVDFLCHGVSPQSYFSQEISYLRQKHGIHNLTQISFRSNNYLNNYHLCLWDNDNLVYRCRGSEQPYFKSFLDGISFRESCFNCRFKTPDRISDLTIGDFNGLGADIRKKYNVSNTSLVIVNTQKGMALFNDCKEEITCEERTIEEAVSGGRSLQSVFEKNPKRDTFRKYYPQYGFVKAVRKTYGCDIQLLKAKRFLLKIKNKLNIT